MLSSDPALDQSTARPAVRRFAVAWRNTARRRISPVAVLDYDGKIYRFQYFSNVSDIEDFRPFVGFPEFDRIYEAERLWPFFALRIMDRRRPDFPRYVRWLALTPDATQLDIMSRSGGERKGDAVQVIEEPRVDVAGNTESTFLVRGARYATEQYSSVSAAEGLKIGDLLSIVLDPSNPTNSSALLVADTAGLPVGWIPDLLIDYVHNVEKVSSNLVVLRNNGTEAPWHLRLLVRLTGRTGPDYRAFTGPAWPSR
jgi:hypothetical protein